MEIKLNVDVPSESWILFQFTPKDRTKHTALNYTSRFDITYKIQSRSHQQQHEDTYYCMSLFKILRSFAVKYRDYSNFFCEDDKHAVNIGEPDSPLSCLLRGRKVMTLKGHETTAPEHDWHRFKVTPSVLLHCHIPETISFYDGQPYVTLKDAVFEKTTPLRHQLEQEKALDRDNIDWKTIECTFSDGGPDHNPRHGFVQMSQVAHFIQKKY